MKKKWLNYLYISGMLLLVSCTQKSALDKTLSSAKENRSELQKVLNIVFITIEQPKLIRNIRV